MSPNRNAVDQVQYQSLPDQVFRTIKRMILSGELKGGERIPELRIAAETGVSRTPIREALRRLGEYGLISIKPRCYAEVLKMTKDEVKDLTRVRVALETLAVRIFVERATPEARAWLKALSDECAASAKTKDIASFYEKDSQFHLEIAHAGGNAFLYDQMVRMDAKVQLSRLVKPLNLRDIQDALAEHALILTALKSGDAADAEKQITLHINNNL